MTSTPYAELFVRADESIRLTILPRSMMLLVCGPQRHEDAHHFETYAALEEFRRGRVDQLLRDGWTLHFSSERRSNLEAFPGPERRRDEVRYP